MLHIILIFPTIIPTVKALYTALSIPITEWNFSVLSIVSNLESIGVITILINFENQVRCITRVLHNTGICIFKISILKIVINTFNWSQTYSSQIISNCGIMSTVNCPLNSFLISNNSLKMVDSLVKISSSCNFKLLLSEK